jgi:hypothetical protein
VSLLVTATFFDQWADPPGYEPRAFTKRLVPEGRSLPVLFRITSGVSYEPGSIGGDFGVFVYCNDRLVLRASKAAEFGFVPGIAGVPHPRMSNARIIVEFSGAAKDMPWNSSQTGLNFNHIVFRAVRSDIHTAVKNATALSSRLQPTFETSIAPYREGKIVADSLRADQSLPQSNLPPIPALRPSPKEAIRDANKAIATEKPWAVGAYESVIAVESIRKQRLTQQNRILLIILDSALEIAFKDYLANEITSPLGEAKLQQLFGNRIDVQKEVEKTVLTGDAIWKKAAYFYKQRCELVHKRVSVAVSDPEIANFQDVVEKLLSAMFGLSFPKS